jgi:CRP-like cAMP-binding protein
MKDPMKNKISRHISIAKHIVDGSITIDSVKEFRSILRIFPNDPDLHRVFADLLAHKKTIGTAIESYRKAATLYIESGMMLQAVVCKLLEWRLNKPSRQKARRFYQALNGGKYHETSLNVFFNRLSFPEFAALINQMKRVQVTAGKTIKKMGEPEKFLYLIAAGNLKATALHPLAEDQAEPEKSTVYLTANDFFGDIYPFDSDNISQSYFETTSPAELIKISRTTLERICKKFPNIELGIIDLLKARSDVDQEEILRKVRQTDRQIMPIKIEMQIYPGKSGDHPIVVDGYTRDVSIGGMCIVLDAEYAHVPSMYQNFKNSRIQISITSEAMSISVLGKIVWSKDFSVDGEKTVALGIQYQNMTPKLSGLVVVFADILKGAD